MAEPARAGAGDPAIIISAGGVEGTVDLAGCITQPSNVQVWISGGVFSARATVVSNGNGTYHYETGGIYDRTYTVRASLLNGACKFGWWTKDSGTFAGRRGFLVVGPTLTYIPPTKTTRVPGHILAGAVRQATSDFQLRVNNHGSAVGASHFLRDDSTVSTAGYSTTFSVPEVKVDVDCGWPCPDAGDARFYVNDLRSSSVAWVWDPGRGLKMTLSLESLGREVKGYFTPEGTANLFSVDSAMPDVDMTGMPKLNGLFVPWLDGRGGVTMVSGMTPTLSASMAATGLCNVFGWDACEFLAGYKARIRTAVSKGALLALSNATVRNKVGDRFGAALRDLGVRYVRAVNIDGDDIVISE